MKIDYLPEDTHIKGYALVSIIGPQYSQKCDTVGVKIRGFAETIDEAKKKTQAIMNYDDQFDIYTVEAGKFFPLNISEKEDKIEDVEYANEELNEMMKKFSEAQINRNKHFQETKREQIQEASKGIEHENIIAVYNTVATVTEALEKAKKEVEEYTLRLAEEQKRLEEYPDLEKQFLQRYINKEVTKEELEEFSKRV